MWVAGGKGSGFRVQSSDEERLELAALLNQARNAGVANLEAIAAHEHAAVGLSYGECLTYLRDHLHFYLGPRETAGLNLFSRHAAELGLTPGPVLAGTKLGPGEPQIDVDLQVTGSTGTTRQAWSAPG